jgi:primosomal protein N' (replication factor Y)
VIANVPAEPALVVATPGAEPVAAGGYAAALLLDGWALAGRPSLRASEEALRRWLNAAALVRPAAQGGEVILVAEPSLLAAQALIRWDPVTHAERELAERTELGFPPAVRMAAITGGADAVEGLLAAATLPAGAEILGPVPADDSNPRQDTRQDTRKDTSADPDPTEDEVRALIRVPRPAGAALARALQAAIATRSTRKRGSGVRVQLDPAEVI